MLLLLTYTPGRSQHKLVRESLGRQSLNPSLGICFKWDQQSKQDTRINVKVNYSNAEESHAELIKFPKHVKL